MSLEITKHSGERVPYSEEKLRMSLTRSGSSKELADRVIEDLSPLLFDGIHTKEIYKNAHRLLKRHEYKQASRYKLKRSLLELGPTGYPFEAFIGELLKAQGYKIQVGINMPGKCVNHEVDVLAENEHRVYMIECKFHNRLGYKTDVKVPLYIHSRFRDLEAQWQDSGRTNGRTLKGAVVTNARFTEDAITYGSCSGLEMLSWDYPEGNALKDRINRFNLYPITSLHSLTKAEKLSLIAENIVTPQTLCHNFSILEKLGFNDRKIQKITQEASLICEI